MNTTTAGDFDLFANAVETPKKKAGEKAVHSIGNHAKEMQRLIEVKNLLENLETEKTQLEGVLKPVSDDVFIDAYKKNGSKPTSFKVSADDGDVKLLYIVQDKYKSLTEAKEAALRELDPSLINGRNRIHFRQGCFTALRTRSKRGHNGKPGYYPGR